MSGSAEPDDAVETEALDGLVAEALELGLLSNQDLQPQDVVLATAPTVTAVAPTSGSLAGGAIIAITGTGFSTATGNIELAPASGTAETITPTNYAVVSDTRIVARVPAGAAGGARTVKVTNGTGTNSTGSTFTYTAPTVTSVSPVWAAPATSRIVTINGTGFTGATAGNVKFGADAALRIWVVSDTQIIAETPKDDAGASPAVDITEGVKDVTVTQNSVASATSAATKFLFSPGAPTVSALSGSGTDAVAAGGTLTITGTNLWGVSKVNFGTTAVTAAADISVSSGTSMTVKVPTRTTAGPVDVTVESAAGLSTVNLSTRFNYIGTAAPTVTSVSPNVLDKSANATSTFLVTGTGFSGSGTSKVTIKCAASPGNGDLTPTSVTVISDTNMIVSYKVGGTALAAESCGLEVVNAADGTKKVTAANAVRFV